MLYGKFVGLQGKFYSLLEIFVGNFDLKVNDFMLSYTEAKFFACKSGSFVFQPKNLLYMAKTLTWYKIA